MIEQVTAALVAELGHGDNDTTQSVGYAQNGNPRRFVVYDGIIDLEEVARKAISSMRNASDEMIDAYLNNCDMGGDLIGRPGEGNPIKRVFAEMIDAASGKVEA